MCVGGHTAPTQHRACGTRARDRAAPCGARADRRHRPRQDAHGRARGSRGAPDRRRVTVGTVLEFQLVAVTQSPETSSAVKRVYKAVFDIETLCLLSLTSRAASPYLLGLSIVSRVCRYQPRERVSRARARATARGPRPRTSIAQKLLWIIIILYTPVTHTCNPFFANGQ